LEKRLFLASISTLSQMLSWARDFFQTKGVDLKVVRRIELALEEALMNVIHYAYGDREEEIEIELMWQPEQIQIQIKDQGLPINPLEHIRLPDTQKTLQERGIGGLGLYLIHQIMDEVSYRRENDKNLFIMIKHFSQMK